MAALNLQGQKFGRLTALRHAGRAKTGHFIWTCSCECGASVDVSTALLRTGITRSCGCLRSRHGHAKDGKQTTATYRAWCAMKTRCTNPKADGYEYYGGRGIGICERWLNSFDNFLADMGEKPPGLTLDRYPNNDGDYEPGNCRWATRREQALNRRQRSR